MFLSSISYVGQINSNKLTDLRTYFFQEILSMDIGLSHSENLPQPGSLTIIRLLSSVPNILQYKVSKNQFERFDLDLGYLEWQQILNEANYAKEQGVLMDSEYVKAKIRFKEEIYNAKVRLKGFGGDHWRGAKRYSLMVSLSGGKTILGNSKFAIQKPATRWFPFGYIYQMLVTDTLNLVPNRNYAHIYMNGENWGIMNIEESFTKELLEKQEAKESIIIRFPNLFNKSIWSYRNLNNSEPYPWYRILDDDFNIHLYNDTKYLENLIYRKYFSFIQEKAIISSSEIYDLKKISEVFLLSTLWGNWHPILDYNLRYYFNPYTLKLEPIPTDQLWPVELSEQDPLEQLLHYKDQLPKIFSVLSTSLEFQREISMNFNKVSSVFEGLDDHYKKARSLFPVDRAHDLSIIQKNIKTINSDREKFLNTNYFFNFSQPNNSSLIGNELFAMPTDEQASNFENHIYARHYTDGRVELYNLIPDKVRILNIYSDGLSIESPEIILESYLNQLKPISIQTGLTGIRDNKIIFETEYRGNKRMTSISATLISENMHNPLSMNAYECDQMCTLRKEEYHFNEGTWHINNPVIFDGDVYIPANTVITFEQDAYIIIKGSLVANGTSSGQIKLLPKSKMWKGIYVLNASNESILKNVYIDGLQELSDGILSLTGGVNFYNSDVTIINSVINNVFAEDALNIVKSNFEINGLEINRTVSDGIDSDFSDGQIKNSIFSKIEGDALDFSGSKVLISNVKTSDVYDKAISAGEESIIEIYSSQLISSNIGITSKDGSKVKVADTSIKDYKLYGAMSYEKKNFYSDAASIELNGCSIDGDSPYLRQVGSMMMVDTKEVPSSSFDVDALYSMETNEADFR